jgi:DNA-binding NarL/FixJ family response regulator
LIRLIIADDHPVIIGGLKIILEKEKGISVVAEVNNGIELLDFLQKHKADVILMDVNMPVMNGVEATKQVRKNHPEIKILAFSQYDEKRFVKQMLKTGASGYLLKNSASSEIINAIKMTNEGGMFLSADLPNIFADSKKKKQSNYFFPELTKRELVIVNQIYLERNSQEISDQLGISRSTVECHRSNILLKVGVKNTAGLVKWAIENDIV